MTVGRSTVNEAVILLKCVLQYGLQREASGEKVKPKTALASLRGNLISLGFWWSSDDRHCLRCRDGYLPRKALHSMD